MNIRLYIFSEEYIQMLFLLFSLFSFLSLTSLTPCFIAVSISFLFAQCKEVRFPCHAPLTFSFPFLFFFFFLSFLSITDEGEGKGKRREELKERKKERKKAGIMMIECLYRIKVFRTYIHTYITFYLNREQRKGQK